MKTVRVAHWGGAHIVYLPMYVALYTQQFEKLGLTVELYPAGNDDEIYREVLEERADFGVGDPTFVAQGPPSKDKPKLVAALVSKIASWGFTHHPEIHRFEELDDFVGLRYGVFPAPSTSHSLISSIKQRSPKRLRTMEVVEAEIGALMPFLAGGRAEVVLEVEPFVSIAEERGLRTVLSLADFFPSLLFTGVTASGKALTEKPEIVEKFVQGIQIGLTTCCREPTKLLPVASKMFPAVSDECLKRAIDRMIQNRSWPEQALIQAADWQNALKLREDLGELDKVEDPFQFLEQSFAYKAVTAMTPSGL